uniref:Uncharacterized protein n=1 Tax=Timema monikensis TaxID=170555 RepID=A0A7R9EG49_9NEOP|nr:unnamed protein product [Timema monikensis]
MPQSKQVLPLCSQLRVSATNRVSEDPVSTHLRVVRLRIEAEARKDYTRIHNNQYHQGPDDLLIFRRNPLRWSCGLRRYSRSRLDCRCRGDRGSNFGWDKPAFAATLVFTSADKINSNGTSKTTIQDRNKEMLMSPSNIAIPGGLHETSLSKETFFPRGAKSIILFTNYTMPGEGLRRLRSLRMVHTPSNFTEHGSSRRIVQGDARVDHDMTDDKPGSDIISVNSRSKLVHFVCLSVRVCQHSRQQTTWTSLLLLFTEIISVPCLSTWPTKTTLEFIEIFHTKTLLWDMRFVDCKNHKAGKGESGVFGPRARDGSEHYPYQLYKSIILVGNHTGWNWHLTAHTLGLLNAGGADGSNLFAHQLRGR